MCAEIMIAIAFHESRELLRNLLIQAKPKALTTEQKLTKLRVIHNQSFELIIFCFSTGNWRTLFPHFLWLKLGQTAWTPLRSTETLLTAWLIKIYCTAKDHYKAINLTQFSFFLSHSRSSLQHSFIGCTTER